LALEALSTVDRATTEYLALKDRLLAPSRVNLDYIESVSRILNRPLLDHQKSFCAHAINFHSCYNGSEQGTGKTATSWLMSRIWNCNRVLIVCPKDLVGQWNDELIETFVPEYRYNFHRLIDMSVADRRMVISALSTENNVAIGINYETIADLKQELIAFAPDIIIFDEAWKLKSEIAQVTQAAFDIAAICPHKLLLSGTPIGNDLGDWFSQLKIRGDWLMWENRDEFVAYFCKLVGVVAGRGISLKPVGCIRPIEMIQTLERGGWFRATKATCLDLPPKIFHRISVPMSREQTNWYRQVEQFGETVFNPSSLAGERLTMLRLQQITGGFIPIQPPVIDPSMTLEEIEELLERSRYRFIGSSKMDWIRDWASSHLVGDRSRRAIVWCRFNYEIDEIVRQMSEVVGSAGVKAVYSGVKNLDAIKASFNSRDEEGVQIIVGQSQKLAYGHNLQAGDFNLYYSYNWSYIIDAQSQDRSHRYGRDSAVEYLRLFNPRTIDVRILSAIDNKEDLAIRYSPETLTS
jgi:SNF2 family DNA or RNA helicase